MYCDFLPDAPSSERGPVKVWSEAVVLPTYEPEKPESLPMFFERRSYQGADGKIYPLPYVDRVSEARTDRVWQAIHMENEHLRIMLLPELGGRIHLAVDKATGYDLVYRQDVIKPALVGLAGLWVSGGIEFNWPQHHRPSTFMPTDVQIESHPDGSRTVWMSEHEPMGRMKGMHGVCLRPGRAAIDVKVRLYNRTALTQTFLWWANVATRVHEQYQSFFPPDVYYVVDHAKRGNSRFPLCEGRYYGVDYGSRADEGVRPREQPQQFVPPQGMYAPNDLSWYANIPVPTSYMCMETKEDFFGGYDHAAGCGLVHVANHHISPGKKQWTWGNSAFGYAWDRNLTDPDADGVHHPYVELMAGVYTDNQPDFSFLAPGETRTFSQSWYPIHQIGPAQQANADAAISLVVGDGNARIGVSVVAEQPDAVIEITCRGKSVGRWQQTLRPGAPFTRNVAIEPGIDPSEMRLVVCDRNAQPVISYQPRKAVRREIPPSALASEPPAPEQIDSADELYFTGLHLEQYRQPVRQPDPYWREALRRDPGDVRCSNALGLWHLRRGEFREAEALFRNAIRRQMSRNPNPADGEPHYNLGLSLRAQGHDDEAYDALYKATWNYAWQAAAFFAIAQIDVLRGDWALAIEHLDRALRVNADDLRARNLKVIALRRLGREADAAAVLRDTLASDPLDWWAHHLDRRPLACDTQARFDVALDYAAAGLDADALDVLGGTDEPQPGSAPMLHYHRAFLLSRLGESSRAQEELQAAARCPSEYCFPARLEEIEVLRYAIATQPADARAHYYLANLLYDRRRHEEAIELWEQSAVLDPEFGPVWRNLGLAYHNVQQQAEKARAAFERAFSLDPENARLLYERDQLWKRLRVPPAERLRELLTHRRLVVRRDDLSIELCALFNHVGRHQEALEVLVTRKFQPWEGGEGMALGEYIRARLGLGLAALGKGEADAAQCQFEAALDVPGGLGEVPHPLANLAHIHFWIGHAQALLGRVSSARRHWSIAADFEGDFQDKDLCEISDKTYYTIRAMRAVGRGSDAKHLTGELADFVSQLKQTQARATYFTTSLPPAGFLFQDDLQEQQQTKALFLEAQHRLLEDDVPAAESLLLRVLSREPSHRGAADLMRELEQDGPVSSGRPLSGTPVITRLSAQLAVRGPTVVD